VRPASRLLELALWILGQLMMANMISDILDACREVLEINGDPQSAYWLASQMVEMRLWRATEHFEQELKSLRTPGSE